MKSEVVTPRALSIRSRLMLLVIVIAVPAAAALGGLFALQWREATREAQMRVRLLADTTAAKLASEFADSRQMLSRLAGRPLVRALDAAQCDPLIHDYLALHPEYSGLAVRRLDAQLVCSYRASNPSANAVVGVPWFREALASEGFHVGRTFVGSATGRWVSALTHPVFDDQGRRVALVILAVDLLALQDRVLGPLPPDAVVSAADRAGVIVLRSADAAAWLGKPLGPSQLERARAQPAAVAEGVDGVRRLYAHAHVADAGWTVVAGLPEAAVLAEPRALLARSAVAGAALLALVLLLAARIAQSIGGPIQALSAVAARVAAGQRGARAAAGGPPEVDEVARQFNHSLDRRERDEQLLQGQRRVLELITTAPLDEVLTELARVVEAQVPGMWCSLLLLDADGLHLRRGAAPSLPEAYSRAIDGLQIGPAVGSCGSAAFRREPVIVEDIATDPRWEALRETALQYGLRACWSVPIVDAEGAVLGTFALYGGEPAAPTPRQRWLMDVATQAAAIAIGHHRAHAALRDSRQALQDTFEHIDEGISILDADLRSVASNRRYRELLDLPEALCVPGTPLEDFFRFNAERGDYGPGDPEAQVRERMARARLRRPQRFERERPDGRIVEVRSQPLPTGGLVTTYTDVTERARGERALQRFRAALNLSRDGIYVIDAGSQRILDCNDGACAALGYTREELVGLSATQVLVGSSRDSLQAQYATLTAGADGGMVFEAQHRRKDGSVFDVELSRRLQRTADGTMVVVIARDAAQRKRAAAALARSEARYRSIVENSLDAVVQMDTRGQITGWNRPAGTLFGWSATEALGRRLDDTIIPPRYREAHNRGLQRWLTTGEGPVLNRVVELHALHRDGIEFPVELAVIADAEGAEFTAFLRDISGRKRAEAERLALEAQLRESQKMEAVGTLAGGIAHDFNNIMGAILGNLVMARQDLGRDHAAQEPLEQVHKAALRARGLVQQLMAFSRRQPTQLASRALAPLVEEIVAMLRATLPAGVSLTLRLAPEPLYVMTDATQLQQVLLNLCTNAWHAMDGRGHIEVGLAPVELAADALRPGKLPPGPYAHLWVADNGRGMDAATRARIFEPFFTTKPVGEGTGLGLAVVHGIVAAHSGAITVDSTPGEGTNFHLWLPASGDGGDAQPNTVPSALEAPRGAGERVLVIDDDEVMRLMIERLLDRAGYRVTVSGDAWQAAAAVQAEPDAFDIVVTDFNMPEFSGLDVLREVARVRPGLPVIVSSGLVTDTLRAQVLGAGARALLRKERLFEELVPLLRRVLDETAVNRESAAGRP